MSANHSIGHAFEKTIQVPHSRYTEICPCELKSISELKIIAQSDKYGIDLMISTDGKKVFATGHSEYDAGTLRSEYIRDLNKG